MNRFKKINDSWCVQVANWDSVLPGVTVTVTLASGSTKQVVLGAYVGDGVYAVAQQAPAAKVEIGSLDGILQLFNLAANRLKFPAVVLDVPGFADGIRISRAGQRAKQPGTLNVTAGAKDDSEYGRTWYGRVGLDGVYSPSRDATPAIAEALKAFAANPVKVATAFGKVKRLQVQQADGTYKLVGQCCFCRKALTDERSTDVGYGKICAGHYGLPWGCTEAVEAPLDNGDVTGWAEQQAHYESATDGSYDGQEDYDNHARRERQTGYWSPRNVARYQD